MNEPIITFESRSDWYGLAARDILEISLIRAIRRVPRSPEIVAGLAEVHGRVVTLIDLDRMLAGSVPGPQSAAGPAAASHAPDAAAPLGVVLAPPLEHLGILVRSNVDVASAEESPQMAARPEEGGLLRARMPVGDRLLNLLSLPALVERVEEAIRDGFRPGSSAPGEEA